MNDTIEIEVERIEIETFLSEDDSREEEIIETAVQESERELTEFQKALKAENASYALRNDSNYWACLWFDTREQKEAFLNAMGWMQFGNKYLDGQEIAKEMGIRLPPGFIQPKDRGPQKSMAELAGNFDVRNEV